MKKALFYFLLLFVSFSYAQVGINNDGSSPDSSAMLDIKSTNSGMLIPRMTQAERDNIASPATGLVVYTTDDNKFYYYDGSDWTRLLASGEFWELTGNSGTDGSQFIGTTDTQPFIIKTNNTERIRIKENGVIGVNATPNDNYLFSVRGDNYNRIGSFVSTRENSDDVAVYGKTAISDYHGYGGKFIGGWIGVKAEVNPTGSHYYYGIRSSVSGGSGNNYGVYSYVSDGDINYGFYSNLNLAYDKGASGYFGSSNATGIGAIANGNDLSSYYMPNEGAGLVANGKLKSIIAYSDYDSSDVKIISAIYKGTDTETDAIGVYGYVYPKFNYGYGIVGYGGYIGVYGTAHDGYAGVYGFDDNSTSYAIYADGDTAANGTKNFVIDHPADPTNKFLRHFSIESNEVLNVYRGNVVLDGNGNATITLPDYFKLVNKNYSYQLTPVGSPAPGIFVAKEINNEGKFAISGGNPGQKISWYVYAERNDPYLQQHPEKRNTVVNKEGRYKGKYLRPELYGQPQSKKMIRVDVSNGKDVKTKVESDNNKK